MAASSSDNQSLLSGFTLALFYPHDRWRDLVRILERRGGGSYGISGPRGAGKTWLMERARLWAQSHEGLGVWFPSPSEYEPIAFLAALSDVTAARYESDYDERTGRTTKADRRRFWVRSVGGLLIAYAGLAIAFFGVQGGLITKYFNVYTITGGLVVALGSWLYIQARSERRAARVGEGRVRSAAEELRRQVRYVVTTKDSSEVGAEAKQAGIGARLRRATERQLVERPATLSSLVHNFRAFAELMAKELEGPVVIAIDELDKMSDAQKVADLLRDIKGVFDISGVYFLVSISDEAARSLQLGAVRSRNEFNSSFYTVLDVPPLDPVGSLALLHQRDEVFSAELGLALGVLTGGIPRELVRIADSVRGINGSPQTVTDAVARAAEAECDAFLRDVLTTEATGVCADEKVALWRCIADESALNTQNFVRSATGLLRHWDLNADSLAWRDHYQEAWRRLIIRMAVAAILVGRSGELSDRSGLRELQNTITLASWSAGVARVDLGRCLLGRLRGRSVQQSECDGNDVDLALFLLERGRDAFAADELNAFPGNGNDDHTAALARFRAEQLLTVDRKGLGKQWRLTDRASPGLPSTSRAVNAPSAAV